MDLFFAVFGETERSSIQEPRASEKEVYPPAYSLVLNRRHAVIVDTANFKGPKICQLFDSAIEILLIGSINTTEQINLIFINIC